MATSRIGNHARLIHTPLKVLTYTKYLPWGIAEQKTDYTVPMYTQKMSIFRFQDPPRVKCLLIGLSLTLR